MSEAHDRGTRVVPPLLWAYMARPSDVFPYYVLALGSLDSRLDIVIQYVLFLATTTLCIYQNLLVT